MTVIELKKISKQTYIKLLYACTDCKKQRILCPGHKQPSIQEFSEWPLEKKSEWLHHRA